MANVVLSTSLTAHITDIRTADKVSQMIRAVLDTKKPLRMDYRCDSPDEMRRFRLTIQPMKDDRVVMVHDLRDAILLEKPMQVWAFHPNARDHKCSMCGAVKESDAWVDPLESQTPHPASVRYTICEGCEARADAAILATTTGDVPEDVLEVAIKAGLRLDQR